MMSTHERTSPETKVPSPSRVGMKPETVPLGTASGTPTRSPTPTAITVTRYQGALPMPVSMDTRSPATSAPPTVTATYHVAYSGHSGRAQTAISSTKKMRSLMGVTLGPRARDVARRRVLALAPERAALREPGTGCCGAFTMPHPS